MRMTIKMPRVADTVDQVCVIEWLAHEGVRVEAGAPLMRVETDKAVVEVPSPVAGIVTEQLVAVDVEVTTGTPIAVISTD
jgi:pyruvate/2-oxoglutarate dehydrogenase complex dihydrolipoamide acyltransferase (E2) component